MLEDASVSIKKEKKDMYTYTLTHVLHAYNKFQNKESFF